MLSTSMASASWMSFQHWPSSRENCTTSVGPCQHPWVSQHVFGDPVGPIWRLGLCGSGGLGRQPLMCMGLVSAQCQAAACI